MMSCTCGSEEVMKKKLKSLQRKYESLRKDHRRLIGVAVELTHALEGYVRGNETDINRTLASCSKIYPNLFDFSSESSDLGSMIEDTKKIVKHSSKTVPEKEEIVKPEVIEEEPKVEKDTEQEYMEGFWSRPKIPRTPQLS